MVNANNPKPGAMSHSGTRIIRILAIAGLLVFLSGFIAVGLIAFNAQSTDLDEKLLHGIMGNTFYSDVYVRFPDGGLKNLSPSKKGIYYEAHISRDGKKVVFFGNDSGPPRIWLADLEKGTVKAITPEGVSARHPFFSWDGTRIAFSTDMGHDQERERIELMHGSGRPPKDYVLNIYVMDTDGGNLRQITTGSFQDQRPAFSPDGETIVFVSNRNGRERLWMAPVCDPKDPIPLQTEGFGYRPCYSPDGRRIYFFTENGDSHQLAYMGIPDKKIRLLSDFGKGNDHGPFVEYDGKHILMHSNRSGKWEIWEASINSPESYKISVPFDEALHATVSENGIMAFDVPEISETRKFLSDLQIKIRNVKNYVQGKD